SCPQSPKTEETVEAQSNYRFRHHSWAGRVLLSHSGLVVCLLRYGDTESAAQDLHGGPASGIEGYVLLPGSKRDLYRAVSAATAAGSGALPWSAAAKCESRY